LKVLKTNIELEAWLSEIKSKNASVGFVPTMGALHKGHLGLVKKSSEDNDYTIVSVFVNPKQFNNRQDFEKYPITIDQDIHILESVMCDAVFVPSYHEVYPEKIKPVNLDLGHLNKVFEGPGRPGHFEGVIQVVHRFFDLVKPNMAYFGLKDFQQCMVIKALRNEYFPKIKLQFCPTEREKNGLAMSSRNTRLSEQGVKTAAKIYEVLNVIKSLHEHIDAPDAINYGRLLLRNAQIEVEYLSLANADTFTPAVKWQRNHKNALLIAAHVEGVRLIDNIIF
jgi:pantoate--beta-alanine ligase